MIDWKKVASKYDGIEIVPYQPKARMNLLWYYGWDIASGCIWNLGNTSLNLISKLFLIKSDKVNAIMFNMHVNNIMYFKFCTIPKL